MCQGPLTKAECLAALRSSANNKSPGLDGFPKEFYLTYWEIVGPDFVEMANCCFAAGKLPQSLRRAIITLIFKKEDPEEVKNFSIATHLNIPSTSLSVMFRRVCVYSTTVFGWRKQPKFGNKLTKESEYLCTNIRHRFSSGFITCPHGRSRRRNSLQRTSNKLFTRPLVQRSCRRISL